jgi:septal ring factor EnvC (AmiA/AmiB activator)
MNGTVLVLGVVATLITSVAGAVGAVYGSRITGRKINSESKVAETKLPAEVDSIIAQATDTAILAMDKVIKAQAERIDEEVAAREREARAHAEETGKMREQLTRLEEEVEKLRARVVDAETALGSARELAASLGEQLRDALAAEHPTKRD